MNRICICVYKHIYTYGISMCSTHRVLFLWKILNNTNSVRFLVNAYKRK